MNGKPEKPPLLGVTKMVAVNMLLVVFLIFADIGDTLLPDPPEVTVNPLETTMELQLNRALAGTILPLTPSTGTFEKVTSVQTVVE